MSKSWKENYNTYMASSRWQKRRKQALEAAGYKCNRCHSKQRKGLHVHHVTYERLGNERDEDLEVLCPGCHLAEHPHLRRKPPIWTGHRYQVRKRGDDYHVLDIEEIVVVMRSKDAALRFAQGADSVAKRKLRVEARPNPGQRIQRRRAANKGCKIYRVDPGILKEWGTKAAIEAEEANAA